MDRVFLEDILHFNISALELLDSDRGNGLGIQPIETLWVNKEVRMLLAESA